MKVKGTRNQWGALHAVAAPAGACAPEIGGLNPAPMNPYVYRNCMVARLTSAIECGCLLRTVRLQ
jgi:hypothetical protein